MHGREDMVDENGDCWWHCIDTREAKKEQETEPGCKASRPDLDKPVRVHLLKVPQLSQTAPQAMDQSIQIDDPMGAFTFKSHQRRDRDGLSMQKYAETLKLHGNRQSQRGHVIIGCDKFTALTL